MPAFRNCIDFSSVNLPSVIFVMMIVDLGAFIGTQSENKYGKDTVEVKYR